MVVYRNELNAGSISAYNKARQLRNRAAQLRKQANNLNKEASGYKAHGLHLKASSKFGQLLSKNNNVVASTTPKKVSKELKNRVNFFETGAAINMISPTTPTKVSNRRRNFANNQQM